MEAIGIIGMVFGISAMALIQELKKEVSGLKKELAEAGVIKEILKNK
jgi:hypothetical protein